MLKAPCRQEAQSEEIHIDFKLLTSCLDKSMRKLELNIAAFGVKRTRNVAVVSR